MQQGQVANQRAGCALALNHGNTNCCGHGAVDSSKSAVREDPDWLGRGHGVGLAN